MLTLHNGTALRASGGILSPRPAANYDLSINSHGDSITRDLGESNYIYGLRDLITENREDTARYYQRGFNGISYSYRWPSEPYDKTMIEDAPLHIDTKRLTGPQNWLIVFAGTNGIAINNNSAATEYAAFKTYVAARIAAGWVADHIVAVTMLPRSGVTDSIRASFNSSMVGDDADHGYRVARTDLNANIGDAGDNSNATYFYDSIHLTAAGHDVVAQIIYDTMFP